MVLFRSAWSMSFNALAFMSLLTVPVYALMAASPMPKSPADLFQETAIWTVHLTFTAEQWAAMEPTDGGSPWGGPDRGRGGFRGPGGFRPSPNLAPAMLYHGGADNQGRLSHEAFTSLAGKWFTAWDKDDNDILDSPELGNGLGSVTSAGRAFGLNLLGPEGGRNGIAAAFGIEYVYAHADLEFEGETWKDVGVRYKGGGTFLESRESLKRPLKVSLNHYVKGQKLAGVTTLNLANCVTDASWMNEALAHRLYRDAGVPAPRTAYARVYLTVTGQHDREYIGLYALVENLDKHFAKEVLGTNKGAILKPVTPSLFADMGSTWKYYTQTYDPKTELSESEIRRIIDLCHLITYADDAELAEQLGDYIDFEELARFMAVMVFLSDVDGILGPGQNLYLHLHPKSNKFTFIPWDQDHSFGQFTMRGTQEQREQLSMHRPWDGPNRFLERLFKLEEFKKAYLARLDEFSRSIFRPERFDQQIESIAAAIRPAVQEESDEKLARFDQAMAGETGRQGGFGFGQPTKPIKPFVRIRTQSITDQLSGKVNGMELGFESPGGSNRTNGFNGPGGSPGPILAGALLTALDADKNGQLDRNEFVSGFDKWFRAWSTDNSGLLGEEQLRVGMDKDLVFESTTPGFPRGGASFGR